MKANGKKCFIVSVRSRCRSELRHCDSWQNHLRCPFYWKAQSRANEWLDHDRSLPLQVDVVIFDKWPVELLDGILVEKISK